MGHLDDDSQNKQAGCMMGIAHVLDYHRWQSNIKKMIHQRKHEARSDDQCEWSPNTSIHERLLKEQDSPHHAVKRSRASKKWSLRARWKAKITTETSMEDKDSIKKSGFSTKSSLQRTYSIHHLESTDDFFGKIRRDWNHPIIFLPSDRSSKSSDAAQIKAARGGECNSHSPRDADQLNSPDVFEIFKMDKELLLKHLQDSDESIANFSRSSFGLNTKGKFSKSRSFPVAKLPEGRKLKPLKLESKQKEVWWFPRNDKIANKSQPSESLDCREGMIANKSGYGDGIRTHGHRRSASLNESKDKYARLFEKGVEKDVKLSSSWSLKLTSECGFAPLSLKRIDSLSNEDSYYSGINFEILRENHSGANLVVMTEDSSDLLQNSEEEEAAGLVASDKETVPLNADMEIKEDDKYKNDFLWEKDSNCSYITLKEVQDQGFMSDSEIFLQDKESPAVELHSPKGKEHESKIHKLDSSINTDDYEMKGEIRYPHKKYSDLDYVRYLLDRSGIAIEGSEMTWHASDQLLRTQLFKEVEAVWPHDELDGWPEFQGCQQHQMLFDAVNEALLEVYDISLPYYPKALSSSCHIPPFPMGNRIIEEVCTSIDTLMSVELEEKQLQSLDCIVARDRSWMNLQLESEAVALDIEDMIFNELLQELIIY